MMAVKRFLIMMTGQHHAPGLPSISCFFEGWITRFITSCLDVCVAFHLFNQVSDVAPSRAPSPLAASAR